MSLIQLNDIAGKEVFPGFTARFIHTANMTLAFWEVTEGAKVPEHSHVNEQVVNVTEGTLELVVDGVSYSLDAGKIFVIPSNVKHSALAVTDCKLLDVFYPVREDYKSLS